MICYSIKEVEQLSGIKAHTLRIWEQRYALFQPKRTKTNIRYYTDNDLRLILNIALLNKYGHRIGNIAKLSKIEICHLVTELYQRPKKNKSTQLNIETAITLLTQAMLNLDEKAFEQVMRQYISYIGFKKLMLQIIYPFLERIGIMWTTGHINPAQEHFMSNLIRQKIIAAIDQLSTKHDNYATSFLLYLPEGELHEISLLFLHFLLRQSYFKVIYLGANVPLKNVVAVHHILQPTYIYTILTSPPKHQKTTAYIDALSTQISNTSILISGQQVKKVSNQLPEHVRLLHGLPDVLRFIEEL